MKSFLARLKAELANADIDLNLSRIKEEPNSLFKVTAKLGKVKILLIVLFGFPCLYLVYALFSSPGLVSVALAMVFCPVLATLASLFGFSVAEKTFDKLNAKAVTAIIIGKYRYEETRYLGAIETIDISSKWIAGSTRSSGHREYRIAPRSLPGFNFVVPRDYS